MGGLLKECGCYWGPPSPEDPQRARGADHMQVECPDHSQDGKTVVTYYGGHVYRRGFTDPPAVAIPKGRKRKKRR